LFYGCFTVVLRLDCDPQVFDRGYWNTGSLGLGEFPNLLFVGLMWDAGISRIAVKMQLFATFSRFSQRVLPLWGLSSGANSDRLRR